MAIAITDNDRFKRDYSRYIGCSFLIAAAIHLVLFSFTPPFHVKPFVYKAPEVPPIELEPIDDIKDLPEPPAVPKPVVNIVPAEDGEKGEDIEVPPNVFGSLDGVLPPPPPVVEAPSTVSVWDEAPVLVRTVRPVYPELSRQAGIEGEVTLSVLVGEDGTVLDVSVIKSSVIPSMERAAVAAARQFRFLPARQGAMPVRARVAVPVTFKLH